MINQLKLTFSEGMIRADKKNKKLVEKIYYWEYTILVPKKIKQELFSYWVQLLTCLVQAGSLLVA